MDRPRKSPPKRGEIVYEVKNVQDWFRDQFVNIMTGIMRVSLSEVKESDPELFSRELEYWRSEAQKYFEQETLDEFEMAYGTWVERELRLAIVNRLALVKSDPIWESFSNKDRIYLAFEVILRACFRCATIRDAALRGVTVFPEPPLTFKKYQFNVQKISLVKTFGPECLIDDLP